MKLTGKAREAFYAWLMSKYENRIELDGALDPGGLIISKDFHLLPEAFQNTLIVEFLDDQGIYIAICDYHGIGPYEHIFFTAYINGNSVLNSKKVNNFASRPEAATHAIEKANEILNERLK